MSKKCQSYTYFLVIHNEEVSNKCLNKDFYFLTMDTKKRVLDTCARVSSSAGVRHMSGVDMPPSFKCSLLFVNQSLFSLKCILLAFVQCQNNMRASPLLSLLFYSIQNSSKTPQKSTPLLYSNFSTKLSFTQFLTQIQRDSKILKAISPLPNL